MYHGHDVQGDDNCECLPMLPIPLHVFMERCNCLLQMKGFELERSLTQHVHGKPEYGRVNSWWRS